MIAVADTDTDTDTDSKMPLGIPLHSTPAKMIDDGGTFRNMGMW